MGKGAAVTVELDASGRLTLLETEFRKHESRVEAGFTDIAKSLRALSDKIDAKGSPIAWKEIGATIITMCMIFAYVGNYLEGQYAKNIAVEKYRLEQVEKKLAIVQTH